MSDKPTPEAARVKAEARFRLNAQRKTDAEQALAEVEAAKIAEAAKTTRLRALRLAKEEADRNAPPPPAKKPVRKRKAT